MNTSARYLRRVARTRGFVLWSRWGLAGSENILPECQDVFELDFEIRRQVSPLVKVVGIAQHLNACMPAEAIGGHAPLGVRPVAVEKSGRHRAHQACGEALVVQVDEEVREILGGVAEREVVEVEHPEPAVVDHQLLEKEIP